MVDFMELTLRQIGTNLPFSSDDELFELIRAQNDAAHVHVLLRQPLVFQAFSGGKS